MRSAHTITVTSEPSVVLEWEARVSEPGDVDPPALVLTGSQIQKLRLASYAEPNMPPTGGRRRPLADLGDRQIMEFMANALRALGVDPPTDEDFTTAASAEVQRARLDEREDRGNERR